MTGHPESVVIVGGGVAGYTLADALRARGFAGRVTIIDREPALYDRPPLSKAAFIDDIGLHDLAFSTDPHLEERGIEVISGRSVVALEDGGAQLDDGRLIAGDALVLATGGSARQIRFPGHDAPIVHTLRTFDDASRIRAAARPGARILVAGAGLIGAELTSSLLTLGVDVTLVDPVEVPIVPAAGVAIAQRLHAMHAMRGADVRIGLISEVVREGEGWTAILADDTRLAVDAVVVGAGLVPNVELAEAAGLEVEDGIVVDERHRVSDGIYAIGDVARVRDADGVLHRREEHWEAAQHDAQELAALLVGEEPEPRSAPWWWSDRYDVHVEGVGRMTGPGETVLRGETVAFHVDGDLLVGAVSINDTMTVRAARRLIDQRIPVSRVDLMDPSVSLRGLLRVPR
ncbi:NAD(P)/FAD-dependent oxidoreductase [Microbacterium sp. No. 7]|uniref:NAD(P)/FAD-dependent oxidoreductase n=1 Tax=Microbacterium sp. No. 7 TaxID=1714373 RepID=UPI0006D08A7E|nr:FAD-dependent oxidoreductase [Microbacterium sp. No. 7]ALJ21387.1 hypothetical protein AOA12_16370 [Microbacterium sp. No. 7]